MQVSSKFKPLAVAAFAFVAFNFSTGLAHAATPPDTCFDFSAGTISNYYDHEGNDILNPACPKNVDIPATIGGTPVTVIGNNSFSGKQLTAVTIPGSVLTIGNSAFHTNDITSLTIGSSVETVDMMAFYNNKLTSVVIPNSVTSINANAFAQNHLSSLVIGGSVTIIGSGAFESNSLTTVVIPNSVITIDELAFRFNYITSLTLGNSVESIGALAFGLNKIQTVNIPNSVTSISLYSFAVNSSYDYDELMNKIGSGNVNQVTQAYDSIYFVKLYTEDPTNPNGLQDSILTEGILFGADNNLNGNQDDVLGGHLINPAEPDDGGSTVGSSNSKGELAATGENVKLFAGLAVVLLIASGAIVINRIRRK